MRKEFHQGNRERLYQEFSDGTLILVFAGRAPRKTLDEYYPFFANRNFVYLTGVEQEGSILLAEKKGGAVTETLFTLPPDAMAERWTGTRKKPEELREISGIAEIRYLPEFPSFLHARIRSDQFAEAALDLYRDDPEDQESEALRMARRLQREYPGLAIANLSPAMRKLRTIKQPCEIAAMREAAKITRAGIVAMMKASHPGMYEAQYKAEWDYALAQHGCLSPFFSSIISAGANNFCIHYYEYSGQAQDGDMVLNDVGAVYDNLGNDVSRGWPCNGHFSERQQLLYSCAYETSQHMFSIIRPGMPMKDVDRLAREYNYGKLHEIGLCDSYEQIGKYMWHGGAHHVGYDVHDHVAAETIAPGMVFCVDIGIYCEEWGIGFRLEDNCLVTEDGCENLTAGIPRTIGQIEAIMAGTKN